MTYLYAKSSLLKFIYNAPKFSKSDLAVIANFCLRLTATSAVLTASAALEPMTALLACMTEDDKKSHDSRGDNT